MRYRYKIIIALSFGFFLLSSCNQSVENQSSDTIEFNVDSNNLEVFVIDTTRKLRFAPPKHWKPVDSMQKMQMKEAIDNSSEFNISFIDAYIDTLSGCVLSYSVFNNVKEDVLFKENSALIDWLNRPKVWDTIIPSEFLYNTLDIRQILMQNQKLVVFKLWIRNQNPVQLDYIIPKENYNSKVMLIESSIGSINKIN